MLFQAGKINKKRYKLWQKYDGLKLLGMSDSLKYLISLAELDSDKECFIYDEVFYKIIWRSR